MLLTVAAVAIFRSELLDIRPVKGLIGGGGGMIVGGTGLGLVSGDHLLLTEEAGGRLTDLSWVAERGRDCRVIQVQLWLFWKTNTGAKSECMFLWFDWS